MTDNLSPRVLAVVDDDKITLALLSEALTGAGYRVMGFRSGEDALSALWDNGVDLVVVDLVLPRMNGLKLARELRRRPWADGLPIVVASALELAGEEIVDHLASGLVDAVLRKPLGPNDLLPVIEELLAARPPRPQTAAVLPAPSAARPAGRVHLDVQLQSAREYMVEYSDNLALGGIFVRTFDPLPSGTEVSVGLTLPFRFRVGALTLRGRVVRSVCADSPGARTGQPGMGIALLDMPEDLKVAMDAYVAGYRAGCIANAPPPPLTGVLLVGLQSLLPGDVRAFLRRAGVSCARCAKLADAPVAIARVRPKLVVVDGNDLGSDPRAAVAPLTATGTRLLVVARGMSEELSGEVAFLDPGEPHRLLDQIAEAVELLQRRATRIPVKAPVVCRRPDGPLNGVIDNVSLTGVSMLLEGDCAVGEKLSIGFKLPGVGDELKGQVSILRVGRAAGEPPMVRVGARFEALDEDSTETLRRFVATSSGMRAYVRFSEAEE